MRRLFTNFSSGPDALWRIGFCLNQRTVWGAIIEEYCLPWIYTSDKEIDIEQGASATGEREENRQAVRSELVSLLQAAGLPELAREVGEQVEEVERFEW